MKTLIIIFLMFPLIIVAQKPTGEEILKKIDANMASKSTITTSKMVIHGARGARTIEAKTWAVGDKKSFTEYLAHAREKGTKMLKLEDKLWIFSPSTDRIIQISGHMLRQSVMGSDLSYEDMMDNGKLLEKYTATVASEEKYQERNCWVVELKAKTDDIAYQSRKVWVDKERFVPLKEELYAKAGKLLKRTELSEITKIGNRWYPKKIVFKDMLKTGDGTEFIMEDIQFDVDIPESTFTKAMLK